MPWNGSGTYSPPAASFPEVNGTVIDAGRYNPTISDVASGITNCLAKDGQNAATANIPMGGFKFTGAAVGATTGEPLTWGQVVAAAVGSAAAPGFIFAGDTDTGLYQVAANELGVSTGGALRVKFNSTGLREQNAALGLGGSRTGAGLITTGIPYGASAVAGGGLLVITGADLGGQSFCAVYLVSTKLPGGAGSVSATLLAREGATNPSLTIGTTGGADGFLTVTVGATSPNLTYCFGVGF